MKRLAYSELVPGTIKANLELNQKAEVRGRRAEARNRRLEQRVEETRAENAEWKQPLDKFERLLEHHATARPIGGHSEP